MKKTRELLMENYRNIDDILKVVAVDSPDRPELLKQKDNILNDLIKLDSLEMEALDRKATMESEEKREKIRNRITIGTFVISTGVTIWAVLKTFRFDQEGTITSTLGRGILGNILPKSKK